MRNIDFAPGEYYHLMVRGNNKQDIFYDDSDRFRFLFLMTHLVSPIDFKNISRHATSFRINKHWNVIDDTYKVITEKRYISLLTFALMPNHIHWLVGEREDGGISRYMQRILNAYTKYFNTKYKHVGHLFQGPFKAVHIENNEQLLHVSAYIHKNPREIAGVRGKEHSFTWSSYRDYLGDTRLHPLIDTSILLDQFKDTKAYKEYVQTNPAKESFVID